MPTFRRRDLLPTVLEPLLNDPSATEVIVASDGGQDGSVELLRRLAETSPTLIVLDLPHGGREAARRAGIEAAVGDVVLLMDDDVRADPGLVSGHARAHADGLADVISGYMPVALPAPRRPGIAPTLLYAAEYEQHCASVEAEQTTSLFRLWGGNVSLPRDLALEVTEGPDFPASFGEDTHMGLRCHRSGASGRFLRSLSAQHLHSRTLAQFVKDSFEQGAGKYWLHHLHPDLLGSLDLSHFTASLPATLRRMIDRHEEATKRMASAVVHLGGAARIYAAETAGVKLLRKVALQEGVMQAKSLAEGGSKEDEDRVP